MLRLIVTLTIGLVLYCHVPIVLAGQYGCPTNGTCDEGEAYKACQVHLASWTNAPAPVYCYYSSVAFIVTYVSGNHVGPQSSTWYYHRGVLNPDPNKVTAGKNAGTRCSVGCFGDPVYAGTGNKFETRQEYVGVGAFPLEFAWTYNSSGTSLFASPSTLILGRKRSHTYSSNITYLSMTSLPLAYVTRPDSKVIRFYLQNGVWKTDADSGAQLTSTVQNGTIAGWNFEDEAGLHEVFDASGRLTQRYDASWRTQFVSYDSQGRISRVQEDSGRDLTFVYGQGSSRLERLVFPDGGQIAFAYTEGGDLNQVAYQDLSNVEYTYDEAGLVTTSTPVGALTGVLDESQARYSSTMYNANGYALSTFLGTGVGSESASYQPATGANYMAQATISLSGGATKVLSFTLANGAVLPTSSVASCTGCDSDVTSITYTNGRPNVVTRNGQATDYDYNIRGLITQKTDAATDAAGNKRTTQTDWHPTLRVPIERRTYNSVGAMVKKEAWTYNNRGQILTHSLNEI